jgi:hypothetical protein
MDKTFTVAGTSIREGEFKLRFANGSAQDRANVLIKGGHTEVKLVDLPEPMTKAAATEYLKTLGSSIPEQREVQVAAKPERVAGTPRAQRKSKNTAAVPASTEPTVIAHEDLGLAASSMSPGYWATQSVATRQEMSRNAAWAQGIVCPKGTYPELEAWLENDGVKVNADGTLESMMA